MSARDYCRVLGVREDATLSEIKQAFRRRAKLLHPDVNAGARSIEQFVRLTEAYRALSDLACGQAPRSVRSPVIVPNPPVHVPPGAKVGPGVWVFASTALMVVMASVFVIDWLPKVGDDDLPLKANRTQNVAPSASTTPAASKYLKFHKRSGPRTFVVSGPVSSIYVLPIKGALSDPIKTFLLDRPGTPLKPFSLQADRSVDEPRAAALPEKKIDRHIAATVAPLHFAHEARDRRAHAVTPKHVVRAPVHANLPRQKVAKLNVTRRHATIRATEAVPTTQKEQLPVNAGFNLLQTLVGGN